MFRRLLSGALVVLTLTVMLAGCTTLDNIKSAYSTATGATVPYSLVQAAIATYTGFEKTATNYIRYCTPTPEPAGCDDSVIQHKIDPAIRSGRAAADSLLMFYDEHPGALGPRGLYDALVAASATLQSVQSIYGVAK